MTSVRLVHLRRFGDDGPEGRQGRCAVRARRLLEGLKAYLKSRTLSKLSAALKSKLKGIENVDDLFAPDIADLRYRQAHMC